MESDPRFATAHDVVVIGGGLIGCSIALRLAQARLRVLVIDRAAPLVEASGAAAGMLAPQGEMTEPDPFFEMCMASRALYPDFAAEVESLSGEKVGYRDSGAVLVAADDAEQAELEHIYQAQSRLGLPIERWTGDDLNRAVPGLSADVRLGLFVPGDHWLDNEKLTLATSRAAERAGATFIWGAAATTLNANGDRIESVSACMSSGAQPTPLAADEFVLAAGCWSKQLAATAGIRVQMEPVRGQMIEFESGAELPFVVRSGMHYLVPRSEHRVVAGTTAERAGFEKAVTGEGLHSILEGVARFAPAVQEFKFRRAWAGLRPDTSDHFPILGRGDFSNLIFATGHFRNGILLAPITAQLIAELILTRAPSHSLEAYSPKRFGN
jgi:glycine oxidase